MIKIDHKALGISDEEMATAGRVARAIHAAARASVSHHNAGKRSVMAQRAVSDTLLRAGGWQSQRDATRQWVQWLRDAKSCTVQQAHEARIRITATTTGYPTTDASTRTRTAARLTDLESEGLIRYVRADRWDPGMVVWIGDEPA